MEKCFLSLTGEHGRVSIIHYAYWQFFWSKTAVALKRLGLCFDSVSGPIKSLAFVMPVLAPLLCPSLAPSHMSFFCLFTYILLTTEWAWRQKTKSKWSREANPSIEAPRPWASLQWLSHSGFRSILFPVCRNNWGGGGQGERGVFSTTGKSLTEYGEDMAQPLGELAIYHQRPAHEFIQTLRERRNCG